MVGKVEPGRFVEDSDGEILLVPQQSRDGSPD
jgi:hypothetical protein